LCLPWVGLIVRDGEGTHKGCPYREFVSGERAINGPIPAPTWRSLRGQEEAADPGTGGPRYPACSRMAKSPGFQACTMM
jgi:hypothetical protein